MNEKQVGLLYLLTGELAQHRSDVAGIAGEMSLDSVFNCGRNTP